MIVGVDVSSRRVDLAWLEDGKPQRWHQELAKGHLIDRLRSIRIQWPTASERRWCGRDGYISFRSEAVGHSITDIAIEYPYAPQRSAIAALMAVTGIVTRQAPPWARVAWPSAGELRAAIGARNTKTDAHFKLRVFTFPDDPRTLDDWDEHELDALVAAVAWQEILNQQEAA